MFAKKALLIKTLEPKPLRASCTISTYFERSNDVYSSWLRRTIRYHPDGPFFI